MCRCMIEKMDKLKEIYGFEYVLPPVEITTGRAYISFTVRKPGKKNDERIPVVLSRCPFCGEPYGEAKDIN